MTGDVEEKQIEVNRRAKKALEREMRLLAYERRDGTSCASAVTQSPEPTRIEEGDALLEGESKKTNEPVVEKPVAALILDSRLLRNTVNQDLHPPAAYHESKTTMQPHDRP